jgi:hypothetical protein
MGGVVGGPIDEAKRKEIEELIKAVVGTFTTTYVKEYGLALVKKIKQDAQADPSPFKLKERPEPTEPLRTGWLVKEGAVVKNWKKRFFVVRPDYKIAYYESEESFKAGKNPKGTINPAGYYVVTNLKTKLGERLKEISERFKIDLSMLPKPKEYPEHTIELHHWRRRSWYIQCASKEEFDDWAQTFRNCCWHAWGLEDNEQVAAAAFHRAVRKTRWRLGRWGWWSYGGDECQIISDIIADELNWNILYDVYAGLTGPYSVRSRVRDQVEGVVDTTVMAAVKPAWGAMSSTVKSLRPKIEEKLKEGLDPIFTVEKDLTQKIQDAIMEQINPGIEKFVSPYMSKIIDIIAYPFRDGYSELIKAYNKKVDEAITAGIGSGQEGEVKRVLQYASHSYWLLYPAYEHANKMYDPLWLLREFFDEIEPWNLIYDVRESFRALLDNAFYTFEVTFAEYKARGGNPADQAQAAKADTFALLKHDIVEHVKIRYLTIVRAIVFPPIRKHVLPPCKTLIEPFNSLIPEPLKDLFDLEETMENLVQGIVDAAITTAIAPATTEENVFSGP